MTCLECGKLLMDHDHGSPCAAEHGASDALPSDAGILQGGEGFGSPRAPLHSVAECEIEDCPDCDDFWRDEMADAAYRESIGD